MKDWPRGITPFGGFMIIIAIAIVADTVVKVWGR